MPVGAVVLATLPTRAPAARCAPHPSINSFAPRGAVPMGYARPRSTLT